ncbi:ABC transporter ATP-binding protein [Acetonema longum]|uniref:ABC transporter related protein n=1 Tax=Acetonema longum DSM 6540 TaxID=1009370 RepID=F7NP09_9FIRM|nr:ABC transporter ATP-binding protein [Acetonema longum]EGO62132.1 ABC transporter related protein [Acetonema longum DSM 6540]
MYAVETHNLTRTFGDFTAVNKVSLRIKRGSIYGFLGPNGSGKSTTIRMLCGILNPTGGSGRILGCDIIKDSEAIKQQIGYMSQKFSLYDDLTIRENLEFYAGMYSLAGERKKRRIEAMLDMAGLRGREQELVTNLSGGWKQRLALGCSILHQPDILFLDEPTGGVDPKARRRFWDMIYDLAAGGTTIMVTTHFMDEAEHCDEIGFIYEGSLIVSAASEELKRQIPGVLLRVLCEEPMALLEALAQEQRPLLDAYAHGAAVHLLVSREEESRFADLDCQVIRPSLEDVFVYYVKSHRKELA